MAKRLGPSGAPGWMVTFADLMSLLVCFFVLIISFSVPDIQKLKIVAGSMQAAFGFTREVVVTGVIEIEGNPMYKFARDLLPIPLDAVIGPIDGDGVDVTRLSPVEVEALLDEDGEPPAVPADREAADFAQAESTLRQAIQQVPELRKLAESLQIEHTPDGLRIQLIDQHRLSMFPLGSASLYGPARLLLQQVAAAIDDLPNRVAIEGHTDSTLFRGGRRYDNWSLSLDRADATRRELLAAGLRAVRIASVTGKADTALLLPDDPKDPRNRRISVTLLRQAPAAPSPAAPSPAGLPVTRPMVPPPASPP